MRLKLTGALAIAALATLLIAVSAGAAGRSAESTDSPAAKGGEAVSISSWRQGFLGTVSGGARYCVEDRGVAVFGSDGRPGPDRQVGSAVAKWDPKIGAASWSVRGLGGGDQGDDFYAEALHSAYCDATKSATIKLPAPDPGPLPKCYQAPAGANECAYRMNMYFRPNSKQHCGAYVFKGGEGGCGGDQNDPPCLHSPCGNSVETFNDRTMIVRSGGWPKLEGTWDSGAITAVRYDGWTTVEPNQGDSGEAGGPLVVELEESLDHLEFSATIRGVLVRR